MANRQSTFQKSFDELKKSNLHKQQIIVSKFYDDDERALDSIVNATNSSGGIWSSKIGGYLPFREFAHEALIRFTYEETLLVSDLMDEIVPNLVQTHTGLSAMTIEEYIDYITVENKCNFTMSR